LVMQQVNYQLLVMALSTIYLSRYSLAINWWLCSCVEHAIFGGLAGIKEWQYRIAYQENSHFFLSFLKV
jgi:hypothetical protein